MRLAGVILEAGGWRADWRVTIDGDVFGRRFGAVCLVRADESLVERVTTNRDKQIWRMKMFVPRVGLSIGFAGKRCGHLISNFKILLTAPCKVQQ